MGKSLTHSENITRENLIAAPLMSLGRCIELVAIDPHFNDITVGLYLKDRVLTVWTFSRVEGCETRISVIRDRLSQLAEVKPVPGTYNQAVIASSEIYDRALKFAFTEAVEKNAPIPTGDIVARDNKSKLTFTISGEESKENGWVYVVSAEGDYARPQMRIRAVVGGYMRYGGCERIDWDRFRFKRGERMDRFARLLLPYARNVSAVDDMIASSEMSGQMTTQTLGFSQST